MRKFGLNMISKNQRKGEAGGGGMVGNGVNGRVGRIIKRMN